LHCSISDWQNNNEKPVHWQKKYTLKGDAQRNGQLSDFHFKIGSLQAEGYQTQF
jgi:hypothetical protein